MKIVYLVNMKENHVGGLFKATYERIIRHNQYATSDVVNINYYDGKIISFLKEKLLKREALKKTGADYHYESLTIHHLNFVRGIRYYFNKIFKLEKNNLDGMVQAFIEQHKNTLAEADLLHAHWGYPNGYIAYQVSKKYAIPYFITFHGSDLNNIKEQELDFLLESMENAATCFFVSQQLLDNALALGYSGTNAAVTYNGVDLEDFKIPDKSLQQDKIVGYIGSLERVKGADRLPELFETIAAKNEAAINFVIVGDGTLRKEIHQKIEASDVPVRLPGALSFEEVPKILEGIDVLVVPSRNEGLGMVVLEANAMGIPAVGTNIGGIPEAIGDPENLIEPNEELIEKMAERVTVILENDREDPNKYRQRVKDQFLWADIVEKEREYYMNALKK